MLTREEEVEEVEEDAEEVEEVEVEVEVEVGEGEEEEEVEERWERVTRGSTWASSTLGRLAPPELLLLAALGLLCS